MAERKTITVEVHDWDESFAVPAQDFAAQLYGLLDTIPPEFRAAAILEFDRIGDDYDYSQGELSLHYSRTETDEEIDSEQSAREARRQEVLANALSDPLELLRQTRGYLNHNSSRETEALRIMIDSLLEKSAR